MQQGKQTVALDHFHFLFLLPQENSTSQNQFISFCYVFQLQRDFKQISSSRDFCSLKGAEIPSIHKVMNLKIKLISRILTHCNSSRMGAYQNISFVQNSRRKGAETKNMKASNQQFCYHWINSFCGFDLKWDP